MNRVFDLNTGGYVAAQNANPYSGAEGAKRAAVMGAEAGMPPAMAPCDERAMQLFDHLRQAHLLLSQITAEAPVANGSMPQERPGLVALLSMGNGLAEDLVQRIERLAAAIGRL